MFRGIKLTLATHSTHSIFFYAFISLFIHLFYFEMGSYVAQAGLDLTMQQRMTLNSDPSVPLPMIWDYRLINNPWLLYPSIHSSFLLSPVFFFSFLKTRSS